MDEPEPLWKAQAKIPAWEVEIGFLPHERVRIRTGGRQEYPNHTDLVIERWVEQKDAMGVPRSAKWEYVGMVVPGAADALLKALWAHLEHPIVRCVLERKNSVEQLAR